MKLACEYFTKNCINLLVYSYKLSCINKDLSLELCIQKHKKASKENKVENYWNIPTIFVVDKS